MVAKESPADLCGGGRVSGLARLAQGIRGWIYPPMCGACEIPLAAERQVERPFLCEPCEELLTPIQDGYCRVCGQRYDSPMGAESRCANCGDRELGFDFAVSAYRSSGAARELMHQFKYGKQLHLSRLMGALITEVWHDKRLIEDSWWVVPVPLHPRRLRERGFNQSHEIAVEMIRRAPPGIDLKLVPLIRRTRHTVRQAQLDRRDRLKNPLGAFEARGGRDLRHLQDRKEGVRILIVDDVMTTGSTVSECAAVLRHALEVEKVTGISVMRG